MIIFKESRAELQKIFQHNVCNNNDFTVGLQTVSETCVQRVRHSDSFIILYTCTANNIYIIWFCDQSSATVVRVTPAQLPASNDQRYQTSCCGKLSPAGSPNVYSPNLNLRCWEHMSGSMHATFSHHRYTMCNDTPSCCRVHSWRPLAYYAFFKIKLASCHLLLYVVYMCQKSLNFIDVFSSYKQKWKLAPFNLAHPVCNISYLQENAFW